MEDEREPLGRVQRLQHNQQRQPDRVGQERLVLGIGAVGRIDDRVGHVHAERLLPPRGARAQHVQRHTRDDRGQPPAQVFHLARVGATEAQPGLLDRVLGLAQRAEHAVGDRAQMGPLLLEALRQPLAFVHRSHPSLVSGHTPRTPETEET